MQKRSYSYPREYAPIDWPPRLPIIHYHYDQPDREITRLHAHNGLELGLCHEGSGVFIVESKIFAFQAGDLVIVNEHEMHFARSTPGTRSRWEYACFDPSLLVGATTVDPGLLETSDLGGVNFANVLPGDRHPRLALALRLLLQELEERSAGHEDAVRGLAATLVAMLHRLPGRSPDGRPVRGQLQRIVPALEYVAARYAEDVTVAELAQTCHLSEPQFRRLFRQAVGQSPKQYLTAVRMRMASSMLRGSDAPVLDLALSVGYPTLSSFNRQFRQAFGCSPRDHRRTPGRDGGDKVSVS